MSNQLAPWVRTSAYYLSRLPVLHQGACYLYSRAASHIEKELLKTPGVKQVAVRGGMVRDLDPTVSDIDLTLILNDEADSNTLKTLKKQYQKLKRKYPMLGECLVGTDSFWQALYQKSIALTVANWPLISPSLGNLNMPEPEMTLETQFGLCLQNWTGVLHSFSSKKKEDLVDILIQRQIDKFWYFAKCVPSLKKELPESLRRMYLRLDELAKLLPIVSIDSSDEMLRPPDKAIELVFNRLGVKVLASPIAGLYVIEDEVGFWERYIESPLRGEFIFLSKASWRAMSKGVRGWDPLITNRKIRPTEEEIQMSWAVTLGGYVWMDSERFEVYHKNYLSRLAQLTKTHGVYQNLLKTLNSPNALISHCLHQFPL